MRPLQAGDQLDNGKYRLIRVIGEGGMGEVFEAEHTVSGKRFAIKCLLPERARAAHAMERMVREARAAARVEHPHAVEVYDVGQSDGTMFLVMEYLKGETLDVALARRNLAPHAIIALLLDGMKAVACAHRKSVVHRDIKPANIFLAEREDNPERVTKILDFGISKVLQDQEEPALTAARTIIGSAAYMSFEQLNGQPDIDARTDVYAFGVILYEALTGLLPYPSTNLHALISHMLQGPPRAPKEIRRELPTPLSNLVLWALARERDKRIASLGELMVELEPYATRRGFEAEQSAETSGSVDDPVEPNATPNTGSRFELTRTQLDPSPSSSTQKQLPGQAFSRRLWRFAAAGLIAIVGLAAASWKPQQPLAAPPPVPLVRVADVPVPAQTPQLPVAAPPVTVEPVTPPATSKVKAKDQSSRARPQRPVPPPEAEPELAALRKTRDERASAVEQARRKLVECGDLQVDWVRENCKERTKRELAQREEDYELADSLLRRKP